MEASGKIAVAGATGRVGRHVVDLLEAGGHGIVPMSRASGVDVVTGEGLADALAGVECVIDAATGPSPDEREATQFFTAATRNLQEAGERAGVQRIVMVSIIGIDKFHGGYYAAKVAHERAMQAGPIPVRILRAAQFHEFVPQLIEWGTHDGDVSYLPRMRTQLVAARSVAEALAELATSPAATAPPISEIAGPRPEQLSDVAKLYVSRRGNNLRIEEMSDPADPESELLASGALLPGPDARIAGPTFEEWLESAS